ncbi:hypothetical protein HDU91_006571 [Kappamyces sp. JEL0680]|nr:hypothetical protein HDU91_006571 [Kappamyces sp. JEL0680]
MEQKTLASKYVFAGIPPRKKPSVTSLRAANGTAPHPTPGMQPAPPAVPLAPKNPKLQSIGSAALPDGKSDKGKPAAIATAHTFALSSQPAPSSTSAKSSERAFSVSPKLPLQHQITQPLTKLAYHQEIGHHLEDQQGGWNDACDVDALLHDKALHPSPKLSKPGLGIAEPSVIMAESLHDPLTGSDLASSQIPNESPWQSAAPTVADPTVASQKNTVDDPPLTLSNAPAQFQDMYAAEMNLDESYENVDQEARNEYKSAVASHSQISPLHDLDSLVLGTSNSFSFDDPSEHPAKPDTATTTSPLAKKPVFPRSDPSTSPGYVSRHPEMAMVSPKMTEHGTNGGLPLEPSFTAPSSVSEHRQELILTTPPAFTEPAHRPTTPTPVPARSTSLPSHSPEVAREPVLDAANELSGLDYPQEPVYADSFDPSHANGLKILFDPNPAAAYTDANTMDGQTYPEYQGYQENEPAGYEQGGDYPPQDPVHTQEYWNEEEQRYYTQEEVDAWNAQYYEQNYTQEEIDAWNAQQLAEYPEQYHDYPTGVTNEQAYPNDTVEPLDTARMADNQNELGLSEANLPAPPPTDDNYAYVPQTYGAEFPPETELHGHQANGQDMYPNNFEPYLNGDHTEPEPFAHPAGYSAEVSHSPPLHGASVPTSVPINDGVHYPTHRLQSLDTLTSELSQVHHSQLCHSCGKSNDFEANFCTKCGTMLAAVPAHTNEDYGIPLVSQDQFPVPLPAQEFPVPLPAQEVPIFETSTFDNTTLGVDDSQMHYGANEDMLQRHRGHCLISFGFGGKIVFTSPTRQVLYQTAHAGASQPAESVYPGSMHVMDVASCLDPVFLESIVTRAPVLIPAKPNKESLKAELDRIGRQHAQLSGKPLLLLEYIKILIESDFG